MTVSYGRKLPSVPPVITFLALSSSTALANQSVDFTSGYAAAAGPTFAETASTAANTSAATPIHARLTPATSIVIRAGDQSAA